LSLATPEGVGGAAELVAACEALGTAVFPGPVCASVLAAQLLPEAERRSVTRGEAIVSLGTPPLMPWAPHATHFLVAEGGRIRRATPRAAIEPIATLGGEPWGRAALELGEALPGAARALALHDLALAAYLAAAGHDLVRRTAEHACTRRQFGRAIGEFQAVAHPLADRLMRCDAARTLARAAGCAFDAGAPDLPARAAVARLSARAAALAAAHTAHQLFGAQSIALEGPVFRVSRRIRQLVSQPPDDAAAQAAALAPWGL
jgi:hypothetical protein